jgi:exopolysaccharide production protein ExoQ
VSANAILAVVILLFSSVDAAGWAGDRWPLALLVRATWWLLYLIVAGRLIQRDGDAWIGWLLRRQLILLVMLAIAFASASWSLAPQESLQKAASLAGTTLLGVYIGYVLAPRQIAAVLSVVFPVLILGSLLALPVLSSTIVVEPTTGHWRGLMDHKNTFGAMAALSGLFYLAWIARADARSPWRLAMAAASLLALGLSRSLTSVVACGAGAAVLTWIVAAPQQARARRRARIGVTAVAIAAALAGVWSMSTISMALGKNATLNGRLPLWTASLEMIRERPLTGYGYGVVWHRREKTLLPQVPVTANRSAATAHDALLNTATELGLPAAALLVAYLIGVVLDARRALRRRDLIPMCWFVTIALTALIVLNVTESYLLAVHSVWWIVCVAFAVMLRRAGGAEASACEAVRA